jgi:hypothetical protein
MFSALDLDIQPGKALGMFELGWELASMSVLHLIAQASCTRFIAVDGPGHDPSKPAHISSSRH